MRAIITSVLLCLAVNAHALDCGERLREAQVQGVLGPLTQANRTVHEHVKSLLHELRRTPSESAFERLSLEHDRVRFAYDVTSQLENSLNRVITMVHLRDLMVEPKDKQTLVRYLLADAEHARGTSQLAQKTLNQLLSSLTRPGIAVDVSRVRDRVTESARLFESCDPLR